MIHRLTALGAFFLILSAAACAEGARGGDTAGTGQGGKWDDPPPNSVTLDDVSLAQLPYVPLEPSGVGTPAVIYASDPDVVAAGSRELQYVFQNEAGQFAVLERLVYSEAEVDQMKALASETPGCRTVQPPEGLGDGDPGIECVLGQRSLVTIRDGSQALLFQGEDATWIQWLEPLDAVDSEAIAAEFGDVSKVGLLIVLKGPAPDLTGEKAVELAERL